MTVPFLSHLCLPRIWYEFSETLPKGKLPEVSNNLASFRGTHNSCFGRDTPFVQCLCHYPKPPPVRMPVLYLKLCKDHFLLQSLTIYSYLITLYGPGSSVGIATAYGLNGPGIESRWGRDFLHLFRPVLGPTQPPVQWVPCLSRG